MVGVSWDDAVAFCKWLSKMLGRKIMLPSEAQWEFAARGTDGREYPWESRQPPDATKACFGLDPQTGQPAPVGSYPAGRGPFGTLDQAGNVWEWCQDLWNKDAHANRMGEPLDPVEGEGAAHTVWRVLRGGGWLRPAECLRAAYRLKHPPWGWSSVIGYRVATIPLNVDGDFLGEPEANPLLSRRRQLLYRRPAAPPRFSTS